MRTSPIARLLIGRVILMMLNVPLTMMCGVVGERASRRNQVVSEVSGNWGGEQTIGGPVLSVPYAIRGPTRQDASRAQHPPFIFFPRPWKLTCPSIPVSASDRSSPSSSILPSSNYAGDLLRPGWATSGRSPISFTGIARPSASASATRGESPVDRSELEWADPALRPWLGAHRPAHLARRGTGAGPRTRPDRTISLRARSRAQRHANSASCPLATKRPCS